jgi:hypothetical protein
MVKSLLDANASFSMTIDASQVGAIIGKGGVNIKKLQVREWREARGLKAS